MLDIQGQSRPTSKTQKDIGCDEYSIGTATNHPLKRSDVGPSYILTARLRSGIAVVQNENIVVFPNPTNGLFYIYAETNILDIARIYKEK